MTYNDVRKNSNKGFSLVELIVVIAIMAVLTAVLAPSLLSYVERSRAQKDDTAMAEVTNAFLLAMSDQDVYDEVLYYTCYGNVSCYVDETSEAAASTLLTDTSEYYVKTKSAASTQWTDQYYYDDNVRLDDEVQFKTTGNMRGVTITFHPQGEGNTRYYILKDAVVNAFMTAQTSLLFEDTVENDDRGLNIANNTSDENIYIDQMKGDADLGEKGGYLFNSVRATVGERIELSSQTYRNSDFTVFIRMGTMGADASTTSGISVYGQWNGTNLPLIDAEGNEVGITLPTRS